MKNGEEFTADAFTVRELVERFGLQRQTAYNWRKAGRRFSAYESDGRTIAYLLDSKARTFHGPTRQWTMAALNALRHVREDALKKSACHKEILLDLQDVRDRAAALMAWFQTWPSISTPPLDGEGMAL